MRRYEGGWGVLYLVYLVVIGLHGTTMWYFLNYIVRRLVLRQAGPSHDNFVRSLLHFLGPVIAEVSPAPSESGCMVLANHVNWSDFVIDICLIPRGVYVSRNILKFLFFPGSIIRGIMFGDVVYFKRGWHTSKTRLYADVAAKISEGRSVIVYPEGTRNPKAHKLPLKLGLVKLAYERHIPIYVSMTSNKADICDENRKLVVLGVVIRNRKSNLVVPTDYDSFDAFVAAVQREWDALWHALIVSGQD